MLLPVDFVHFKQVSGRFRCQFLASSSRAFGRTMMLYNEQFWQNESDKIALTVRDYARSLKLLLTLSNHVKTRINATNYRSNVL